MTELSVPFSSGCALRHILMAWQCGLSASCFQFPSHRDVLCDRTNIMGALGTASSFQFPSHRDVLCDFCLLFYKNRLHKNFQFPSHRDVLCDDTSPYIGPLWRLLSVPFSSGCALRRTVEYHSGAKRLQLSVPFSSGCALRLERHLIKFFIFCASFSSLLIGMCFATGVGSRPATSSNPLSVPFSSGCALRHTEYPYRFMLTVNLFQFPSHRDVLCDI